MENTSLKIDSCMKDTGMCGREEVSLIILEMLKNMVYACDQNVLPNVEPHK